MSFKIQPSKTVTSKYTCATVTFRLLAIDRSTGSSKREGTPSFSPMNPGFPNGLNATMAISRINQNQNI